MQAAELNRYKQRLLEIRSRTRGELNRIIDVVLDDADALGEHDRTKSEAVDKELALEHTEESIRSAVNAALKRIEAGTYGRCEGCGQPIAKARLDALPFAAFCIDCERAHEASR